MNFLERFDIWQIIASAFVLLTCLPVHEFAHAFAAKKCGDNTAEEMGRLTLNPVTKKNAAVVNLDSLLKIFEPYGGIKLWIDSVTKDIQEMKLSSFGIFKKDIPHIVEHAFTAGRMDNNPATFEKKELEILLSDIL